MQFSDFAQMSSKKLANSEFYQEFFKRHQNWERLSASWHKEKERCAEFVLTRSGVSSRILSVGCGLGAMEHYMHAKEPQLDLFIHEVAPSAWRWIEGEFTEEHKFLGLIPTCLPNSIRFDLIYLSAVDYAMDDDVLVSLLATLRSFLISGGQCLLISASFQSTPVTLRDKAISYVRGLKTSVAAALAISGIPFNGPIGCALSVSSGAGLEPKKNTRHSCAVQVIARLKMVLSIMKSKHITGFRVDETSQGNRLGNDIASTPHWTNGLSIWDSAPEKYCGDVITDCEED